jgi:hypothetical protein
MKLAPIFKSLLLSVALAGAGLNTTAFAQDTGTSIEQLAKRGGGSDRPNRRGGDRRRNGGSTKSGQPAYYGWMNSEIQGAWRQGFLGQGTRITVIDDFSSNYGIYGDLTSQTQLLRHGEWTRLEASLLAPGATIASQDFNSGNAVALGTSQLNTLNLSYGMIASEGYSDDQIGWSAQESSIISYAHNGNAVIVKAAGNDAVAVGAATGNGIVDYLNRALIGGETTLFVGALDRNGTTSDLAQIASYSNYAGDDVTVQGQFLTVGVAGNQTGLYGTSFAAPVISGYSAVLGSKFTTASPTQIANQLLDTARTDTILGYDPSIHGQGEASIARALAPAAIQ